RVAPRFAREGDDPPERSRAPHPDRAPVARQPHHTRGPIAAIWHLARACPPDRGAGVREIAKSDQGRRRRTPSRHTLTCQARWRELGNRRPPDIGRATPVVDRRDSDRARTERTPRWPKACARSASPSTPPPSAGRTKARRRRRTTSIIAGLRLPPPHTSHSCAGAGKCRAAAAIAAAVISVSVAAP